MVRSYRRYEPAQSFGTICTATSNSLWTPDNLSVPTARTTGAGRAYVGANEDVLSWSLKTGELLSRWSDNDNKAEVTCLAQCAAQPDLFAAGYADGSIRIWDAVTGQVVVSFNGHRSAITQLAFDREGARLASGSKDTDIIVWNLLSETAECRLRGHKDQITGLSFLRSLPKEARLQTPGQTVQLDDAADAGEEEEAEEKYLLTTSKDALIKLWDLGSSSSSAASAYCIETHIAQTNGECWALALSPSHTQCITAGNDGELKVWRIDLQQLAEQSSDTAAGATGRKGGEVVISQGVLHRQGKDRTVGIGWHPKGEYVAVHGSEKAVEIWRIRSAEEAHRHLQRKRRRRREKAAAAVSSERPVAVEREQEEEGDNLGTPDAADIFVPHVIVRTGGKVRSTAWASPASRSSKTVQLMVSATNNQIELYSITTHRAQQQKQDTSPEYNRSLAVDLPGHRTDIRTLALSSDDRMLATASSGQLKIWNLKTRSCLRTLECGQALCSAFLPGDRIVLLGTKSGDLELYDISTSTLIESLPAHEGQAIWTLAVQPDGKGVVTGSADKSAKFWRFDVVEEEIPGTRRTTQRLRLVETRRLKVADDVLSVCFSPDGRLLAVATLDNTVKIFFTDSLKLFLTLYGHKLPVLSLSISSDSKLIATCSADKNVRIWGLDFGDCHKAFFAHRDSVMAVGFIPHPVERDEGHVVFSASKDGVVKSWDGDKFEQIQKMEGHKGEIWAMVVGRTGEMVVTASHDKSVRVWEVGDDLVFLEEEREREQEEMYEAALAQNLERDARDEDAAGGGEQVGKAGRQTIATLTHGEKVMEALEIGIADLELMRAYSLSQERNSEKKLAPPQRNPLFMALGNISAEAHVLAKLRKIPTPALNDALLVLPFSMLPTLFSFLAMFLEKRMQPELAWRVCYFLLQAHMQQIIASRQLRPLLERVLGAYEGWQDEERRIVGFNLAGLEVMGREAREKEEVSGGYIDEIEDVGGDFGEDAGKGRKKRGFASLA